ncbi:MAG: hypothetical protein J2P37_10520 [Ktedonobacteraceae bacterium]|nr:hypothetical protein [Ktedonobacteraceae bacterium]
MCNRCGYDAPNGAQNCPQCGAPLTQRMESGFNPGMGGTDQTEIPAWLETLRAGDRPPAPPPDSGSFSAADLLDEGALPGWMRAQRGDSSADPSLSGPHSPLRPASFSAPTTNGQDPSQKGISAQSLIDESSLPSWMQGDKSAPDPESPAPPGQFSASSLVDDNSLPSWMKSQQGQPAASSPEQTAMPDWMKSLQPPSSQPPSSSSSSAGTPSFSAPPASALPQPESPEMPDWMKSLHSASQLGQPVAAEPPNGPDAPPPSGFSPRDLVDEQSLPSWMKQGGQPGTPASSDPGIAGGPPHTINSGPGMLTPGSLIDEQSLPSWMKQDSSVPPSSLPPSMVPDSVQPSIQGSQSGQNIPASSFIDVDALPDWLKSAAGHYQEEQAQRSGSSDIPSRVENMRVPSRPRHEINSNENSEAAANAFASMLGVASASPQFPGPAQSTSPYGPQGQPGAIPPSQQGYPPTVPPSQQGYMAGPSSMVPPSVPPGQMPEMPGQSGPSMPGYGAPPPSYGGYQQGMAPANQYPGGPPPSNRLGPPGSQMYEKKRSLFDKLRDFFGFQK